MAQTLDRRLCLFALLFLERVPEEVPVDLSAQWQAVLAKHGLERPSSRVLIHVYRARVVLIDGHFVGQSVTPADPDSDPSMVVQHIVLPWPELQKSDAGDNWFLCKVNPARRYARDPALCNPTYVLVLRTESLLQQRPHGLLEVSWGSRDWVTAIAAPRFINGYNCMAMMKNICGPVFERLNEIWCDGTRISEELAECRTGFFLQFHLVWQVSDQIKDDLQVALDNSLHSLHLPHRRIGDSQVVLQIFVAKGSTCYSGTKFMTIVESKNWETHLIAAGRRACPTNYGNVVHYRPVHRSMDETGALHDRRLRSFVVTETSPDERETCCIVVAVYTPLYSHVGACNWPRSTCQWDLFALCGRGKYWVLYHNCQRLARDNIELNDGDFLALFERNFEARPLADFAAFEDQDSSRGFLADSPERILLDTPYCAEDTPSRGDASVQESVPPTNQSWLDKFQ